MHLKLLDPGRVPLFSPWLFGTGLASALAEDRLGFELDLVGVGGDSVAAPVASSGDSSADAELPMKTGTVDLFEVVVVDATSLFFVELAADSDSARSESESDAAGAVEE
jgi:hypothetical protein